MTKTTMPIKLTTGTANSQPLLGPIPGPAAIMPPPMTGPTSQATSNHLNARLYIRMGGGRPLTW